MDNKLEELYQEYIKRKLPIILQCIENAYDQEIERLYADNICHFSSFAKKTALFILKNHLVSLVINQILEKDKLKELEQCKIKINSTDIEDYLGTSATENSDVALKDLNWVINSRLSKKQLEIEKQYEYIEERLRSNEEIHKKLQELHTCKTK